MKTSTKVVQTILEITIFNYGKWRLGKNDAFPDSYVSLILFPRSYNMLNRILKLRREITKLAVGSR